MRKTLVCSLLVGVVVALLYAFNQPSVATRPLPSKQRVERFEEPVQPLPLSGCVQLFSGAETIAPFEIKAAEGSHYLVKLVDAYTGTTVLNVFVRGGTSVSVDVPLGTYEVRYASGETWYGYEHFFGPKTVCSKADKTFAFNVVGGQISGYTISLYKVANGNLRTSQIKTSQF